MIVCSCQQVSDFDIELALLDILNEPEAPIPTPGVVYRYMQRRMQCCGCAPLAVDVIYAKLEDLEARGLICPYRSLSTRERLQRIQQQQRRGKQAATASEAEYEAAE
jgi:bacterioferritin-associated ferredoxin